MNLKSVLLNVEKFSSLLKMSCIARKNHFNNVFRSKEKVGVHYLPLEFVT